jgi:hypothetical protein
MKLLFSVLLENLLNSGLIPSLSKQSIPILSLKKITDAPIFDLIKEYKQKELETYWTADERRKIEAETEPDVYQEISNEVKDNISEIKAKEFHVSTEEGKQMYGNIREIKKKNYKVKQSKRSIRI